MTGKKEKVSTKNETKILKEMLELAKDSTSMSHIAIGDEIAKVLKVGKVNYLAMTSLKWPGGFEAYFDIRTPQKDHAYISQRILEGASLKDIKKSLKNEKLKLVFNVPLQTTEAKKRQFVDAVHRKYKNLIKEVKSNGRNGSKIIRFGSVIAESSSKKQLTQSIKKRNQIIKIKYKKFRKQGESPVHAFNEIRTWLGKQTIWKGRKKFRCLKNESLKKICYSKNM